MENCCQLTFKQTAQWRHCHEVWVTLIEFIVPLYVCLPVTGQTHQCYLWLLFACCYTSHSCFFFLYCVCQKKRYYINAHIMHSEGLVRAVRNTLKPDRPWRRSNTGKEKNWVVWSSGGCYELLPVSPWGGSFCFVIHFPVALCETFLWPQL